MIQSIEYVNRDKKRLEAKILLAVKRFEKTHHVTVANILINSNPSDILETVELVIKNPFQIEGAGV